MCPLDKRRNLADFSAAIEQAGLAERELQRLMQRGSHAPAEEAAAAANESEFHKAAEWKPTVQRARGAVQGRAVQ